MRQIIGVVLFLTGMMLQGCATTNSDEIGSVSPEETMQGGTPTTDYIYRSPSYQISHGGFGRR
jgi:hypothetical protein